jgi:hypothetical protein
MKLGDFLNTMAGKLGLQNEQALKDLLAKAELADADIADAVANKMTAELMSLDGAKNNAAIKNHFYAEALNGVDSELAAAVNELGLDAELFKESKNTYAKVRTLREKLKEVHSEKSGSEGKEKSELQRQINELNDKLAKKIEAHQKELTKAKTEYDAQMLNHLMFASLKGRNYANKEMPADTSAKIAQMLITDELARRGIKPVNDNGALKLKQAADIALDYFDENHKALSYDDFAAKVLADNKLLAVSDPGKGNNVSVTAIHNNMNDPVQAQFMADYASAIQNSINDIKS